MGGDWHVQRHRVHEQLLVGSLQCVRVRGGVVTWGGLAGRLAVVVAAGRVVLAVPVLPLCPSLSTPPSLAPRSHPGARGGEAGGARQRHQIGGHLSRRQDDSLWVGRQSSEAVECRSAQMACVAAPL